MWEFNIDRFSVLMELWCDMHNVTNAEFAELAGISVSTFYALKKGDYAPTVAQLTNVCNLTMMPPETFFKKVKKVNNGK